MDAGVVLGVIGVVIGLGSAVFAGVVWRLEHETRRHLVAIERTRLHADLEDREATRRAHISATQGRCHLKGHPDYPDDANSVFCDFSLRNLGPSPARHVLAWVAVGKDLERASTMVGDAVLGPGEERRVSIGIRRDLYDDVRESRPRLMIKWHDLAGGPHVRASELDVTLDRDFSH